MRLSFRRRQFCSPSAAIINGVHEIVIVVVVRAPQYGLVSLVSKSLRRNFYFGRLGGCFRARAERVEITAWAVRIAKLPPEPAVPWPVSGGANPATRMPGSCTAISSITGAIFFGRYARLTQLTLGAAPLSAAVKTAFHCANRAGGQPIVSPAA